MTSNEIQLLKTEFLDQYKKLEDKIIELERNFSQYPDQVLTIKTLLNLYMSYSKATYKLVFELVSKEAFVPVFRATFESFLNVQYFLVEEDISKENKTLAYRYCEAKNFLSTTDYLYYSNRNKDFTDNKAMIKLLKELEKERIKRLSYLDERKKSSEAEEYKRLANRYQSKRKISWYTLYSECFTLKELSKKVNMTDFYQYFYTYLSIASHGVGLFNETVSQNEEVIQFGILYFLNHFMSVVLGAFYNQVSHLK